VHSVLENETQCEIQVCDSSADAYLSLLGCEIVSIGKCSDYTLPDSEGNDLRINHYFFST
jgi:hypothetical protein